MDKILRRVLPVIFAISGIMTIFISVGSLENNKIEVWECIVGGFFGFFFMATAYIVWYVFALHEYCKWLEDENDLLQTRNADLLEEVVDKNDTEYRNRVHTPLEEEYQFEVFE